MASFTNNPKPSQFDSHVQVGPYSEEQVKLILGLAVSNAVEVVMSNHFFQIGGKIYNQQDGGSIGMDITCELASLVMLLWDEKFLKKLRDLHIKIDKYCRYVDDTMSILRVIKRGWFYCTKSNKMKFSKDNKYAKLSQDEQTMNILRHC